MNIVKTIFWASVIAVLSGCMGAGKQPTMTPMEIQAIQTRDFEHPKDIVFPSVVSVFQDIGYSISNADLATGIIAAESAARNNASMTFWLGVSQVKQTKVTAFVETIGSLTKVRLNFVEVSKSSSSYGQNDRKDTPILDAKVYQNAFEKVDTAIFVRSQ